MSCQKNKSIWSTILNREPKDTIIFVGGGADKPTLENRILTLPCRDTYDGLCEKLIHMISAVRTLPSLRDYTHILKHDDIDAHCSSEAYTNICSILNKTSLDYAGQRLFNIQPTTASSTYHYDKVPVESFWHNRPYINTYTGNKKYCGGGQSYVLSMKAMDAVLTQWNTHNIDSLYETEIYEDLMIGKTLVAAGIQPVLKRYLVQCLDYSSLKKPMYSDRPFYIFGKGASPPFEPPS